jgi:hypothetical protein
VFNGFQHGFRKRVLRQAFESEEKPLDIEKGDRY